MSKNARSINVKQACWKINVTSKNLDLAASAMSCNTSENKCEKVSFSKIAFNTQLFLRINEIWDVNGWYLPYICHDFSSLFIGDIYYHSLQNSSSDISFSSSSSIATTCGLPAYTLLIPLWSMLCVVQDRKSVV